MPWAAWAGAGPFCTSWGARAGLAHCGWAPVAAWGCIQLPCRGADAELSPPRAAARVDPAVPLQLRAGNGVSRGRRAPQRERRGCRAGCGLAAGWGGRGRGQGQGAMLCTLGGSVSAAACQGPDAPGAAGSWARCVCSADMVGLALFLGDELGSAWKRGLGEGRAAGRCCLEPVPLPGSHRMDSGCPGETLPHAARLCQALRALALRRQCHPWGGWGGVEGTGHALDVGAPPAKVPRWRGTFSSRAWPAAPHLSVCKPAQATCPCGYQDCLAVVWVHGGVREPPWDVHIHAFFLGMQGTAAGLRSAGRTWALGSRGICYLGIAAITWGKPPATCSVSPA